MRLYGFFDGGALPCRRLAASWRLKSCIIASAASRRRWSSSGVRSGASPNRLRLRLVTMADLLASLAGVTGVGLAGGATSDALRRMIFGPSSATAFFRRGGRL